jgi:hypothetical protein
MDDGIGGMGAGGSHYRPNADEPSAEQCGKLLETNGYQEFFCANKKPCPKHDESPAPASAREAQAMQKLRPLDDSIHAISELIVMGFVHRSDRKTPNEMIVEAEISIKQLFSTYATLAPQVAGPNYPQCPKCLGGVRLECDYAMYPTVECVGYCSAVEIESINDLIPFFRGAPPADQSVTASSGMLRYLGDVMKQPAGEVEIGGAPPAESREGQYILEHCENPPEPSEEVKARFARMGAPAEPQRWREVKVELPEEGSEVFAAVWWTTEETSHSSYEVHDCCFWKQGEEWGPKDIFVDCDGTEFDVEEVSFWIYRKDLVGHLPAPTPLPSPPKGERP